MTFKSQLASPPMMGHSEPILEESRSRHPAVDYDLVIVGGGLVGLTLACALKNSGLQVALVEANTGSAAVARGQAYSISLLSSQIFAGIGVWEQMRSQVNPYEQIRLSDADHPGVVEFFPSDLGTSVLGYVAEHRVVLDALQQFLHHCANVTYLCPTTVVKTCYHDDYVELELAHGSGETQEVSGNSAAPPSDFGSKTPSAELPAPAPSKPQIQTVRSRLLVAADGARSPIRQQAGIRTHGWQYWQSCVVAFIQPEKSHNNIAYERFWSSGPFAILPLPGNLCRIVWTVPKAEAEAIAALDDATFLSLLKQRYGDQMGGLSLVGGRYVFPVQLMQSARYTLPRLALIGDAAHCCHPVGGQGVNLGIRDAAALAEVLQQAQQQQQDIGDESVLKQYERWRKPENLTILGFTDFLDRIFSNNLLPLVLLRRAGLWALQRIRPVKRFALRLMTGLTGRLPNLAQQ